MGYDQVAYLDVSPDQADAIERFMAENGIDPAEITHDDRVRVGAEFGKRAEFDDDLGWVYEYNDACGIHEIWCLHHSSFIRDDERFDNRRFQTDLCRRLGKDAFPSCLDSICWRLRTRDDAIEIADALGVFFSDDRRLTEFAQWLRRTATVCSTYELSY